MTLYEEHEDSGKSGYPTSAELWRPLAESVGGFDLDPAAGTESEQIAANRYIPEDDGLAQSWHGTVWLNPPFSEKLAWFRKLVGQINSGAVDSAVALAPVDTSTQWFQRWFSKADAHGWLEGRDWYEANGSPPFNTVVGVWNVPDETLATLDRLGTVTQPISPRNTQQTLTHD